MTCCHMRTWLRIFSAPCTKQHRHDPTNPECTTRRHCVYSQWMVGDAVEQHGYTMPAYLRAGCHKHMKRTLTSEIEQCSHCSQHLVLCYPLQ
jgi:hypothetical protein